MANIDTMQQEAMRRVREMHSFGNQFSPTTKRSTDNSPNTGNNNYFNNNKSNSTTVNVNNNINSGNADNGDNKNNSDTQNNMNIPPQNNATQKTGEQPENNLLDMVLHDKERSLVMLLMLILLNENPKPDTLLALMYLMM